MNRQLYGLGSLVKKITRGAKKAVKKVAGGIGDILSSDIGKAALIYGATAGLGALGAGAARAGSGFGFLAPSNVLANLGATGANIAGLFTASGNPAAQKAMGSPFKQFVNKITGSGNIGKFATLGSVSYTHQTLPKNREV